MVGSQTVTRVDASTWAMWLPQVEATVPIRTVKPTEVLFIPPRFPTGHGRSALIST
jgi:hypothetical protein